MLLLAASLFFVNPAPLDMPRAQAFLVEEDGVRQLEDRYDGLEMWQSRQTYGRWYDDDGRIFILSCLDVAVPALTGETETRTEYSAGEVAIGRREVKKLRAAMDAISPIELAEKGRSPRQLPTGYKKVEYWHSVTSTTDIVCAFLPENSERWYFAVWQLAAGDDFYAQMEVFEKEFLCKEFKKLELPPTVDYSKLSEREAHRADARHSIEAYSQWHFTDSKEFVVLDDLTGSSPFVTSFTNELPKLRQSYAEVLPSPISGSNVLCVARIYRDRDEYQAALQLSDTSNLTWSAAYWSPSRRELVAYMPDAGVDVLMKTIRHEAFHQYLSYASSMITVSPWLNEGYAQYFEDTESLDWGAGIDDTEDKLDMIGDLLPTMMMLDYAAFYAGSASERHVKYRLAWSIAVFLEKGAPQVRFQPFKNLKADYMEALLKYRDPQIATRVAFGGSEKVNQFVAEWKRFWKEH